MSQVVLYACHLQNQPVLSYTQQRLCLELVQALLEGYSATDADLREQVKGEGSMATVAFVCGRQLVVATAGTSCAYLDTGAHIYPVRHRLTHVDGVSVDHLAPSGTQSCQC